MAFEKGQMVRVLQGTNLRYGVVDDTKPGQVAIRFRDEPKLVWFKDSQVALAEDQRTTTELLIDVMKTRPLLLLGCPTHGANCIDSLLRFKQDFRAAPFGTVFIEGLHFDAAAGVKAHRSDTEAALKQYRLLGDTCVRVFGLETSETDPDGDDASRNRFMATARNTVANRVWAEIIRTRLTDGRLNIVCCGVAHLVPFQEANGVAPSLQQELSSFMPNVPAFAVTDADSGRYKPIGSAGDSLPAVMPLFPERAKKR